MGGGCPVTKIGISISDLKDFYGEDLLILDFDWVGDQEEKEE